MAGPGGAGSAPPAGPVTARRLTPPDGGPGTSDHVLTHDGRRRAYRVHVPPVLPMGAPLVIQLHGGGGNGVGLDRLTRFHHLADRERFAVASPNGFDRHWNDGRQPGTARRSALADDVDDVGFVVALIDRLAEWLPLDRSRVYAVGISNGAMMTARLASQIPDRIAAFAQVAGTVSDDAARWWHPDRAVPLIQIHGTADDIVPYAGGAVRSRRGGPDRGRVLGVDRWAQLVATHNGAAGPDVRRIDPDVEVRTWRGPTGQGDVEFWRVDGGGHTWPGGIQYLPAGIVGRTSDTFDATGAIWRFLSGKKSSGAT
jgi:polyhydroxybutyrate depolymerase